MHIVAVVFAVLAGVIILAGYYVPALAGVQNLLLSWAIILAGAAAIVGVFNLVLVHADRINARAQGGVYSAILLICLLGTFIFGLAMGPSHPDMRLLINAVVVPVEASLMALLAVSLVYASVRLLRRRANLMSAVFLLTAVVMLIASATLPFGEATVLNGFLRPWLQHVLAMGGARGILIGMGLGSLVTGLRVLLAADRPYGER